MKLHCLKNIHFYINLKIVIGVYHDYFFIYRESEYFLEIQVIQIKYRRSYICIRKKNEYNKNNTE